MHTQHCRIAHLVKRLRLIKYSHQKLPTGMLRMSLSSAHSGSKLFAVPVCAFFTAWNEPPQKPTEECSGKDSRRAEATLHGHSAAHRICMKVTDRRAECYELF
jgi:hypothetical protein